MKSVFDEIINISNSVGCFVGIDLGKKCRDIFPNYFPHYYSTRRGNSIKGPETNGEN